MNMSPWGSPGQEGRRGTKEVKATQIQGPAPSGSRTNCLQKPAHADPKIMQSFLGSSCDQHGVIMGFALGLLRNRASLVFEKLGN